MNVEEKAPYILLVDDEMQIIRALEFKLSKAGFRIQLACDGDEAWEKIISGPPDLLITDFQMPNMNGLELIRRVRDNELTREIPTILLTAKQIELKRAEAMNELSIDGCVAKPFSPRKLTADVCRLLEESGFEIPESAQNIRAMVASKR